MTAQFMWTTDRQELVGKLVRRLAFDFDAASNAFRDHLTSQKVDFNPDATNPTSLRKVFATLDRKRAAPVARRASIHKGHGQTNAKGSCLLAGPSDGVWGNSVTERASREHLADDRVKDALRKCDFGLTVEREINGLSPQQSGLPNDSREGDAVKASGYAEGTGEATALPSTDEPWSFDSFLEDQRRKEIHHDDQKEKLFHNVLSALGGVVDGSGPTAELPPEILQAWGVRNDKLVAKAEEANKRRLKLEEDRTIALQRQSLKQRHLPGSADCVGEDPLATAAGCTTTGEESVALLAPSHPRYREHPEEDVDGHGGNASLARCGRAGEGPVRLELGMDSEVLEKILDEHEREFAIAAGGYVKTNSELSRVLDELDEAAARGGSPATTASFLRDVREQ